MPPPPPLRRVKTNTALERGGGNGMEAGGGNGMEAIRAAFRAKATLACSARYPPAMQRILRFTHPRLDYSVEVRLREYPDGKWLAVADFAGEPDVGTAFEPRAAIRVALDALGEPYASEMARDARIRLQRVHACRSQREGQTTFPIARCVPWRISASTVHLVWETGAVGR